MFICYKLNINDLLSLLNIENKDIHKYISKGFNETYIKKEIIYENICVYLNNKMNVHIEYNTMDMNEMFIGFIIKHDYRENTLNNTLNIIIKTKTLLIDNCKQLYYNKTHTYNGYNDIFGDLFCFTPLSI